ncbi:hypothetical protein [Bacillus cereus group sp. BfR-BA-01349]|uniref:hypothetical protein n=1 Tax=Bacillus cereus group sp. BfR-BA-01349 TaxID=2920312 RepID=UPI001F58A97F
MSFKIDVDISPKTRVRVDLLSNNTVVSSQTYSNDSSSVLTNTVSYPASIDSVRYIILQ